MNRTTKKIFKFIYDNPSGMCLSVLYKEFSNHAVVYECCKILIKNKLIVNRNGSIELTSDGYDYYYNCRKELLLKILKTLISPIVVAVVASLITAKIVSPTNDCRCDVTCDYTNSNNIDDVK